MDLKEAFELSWLILGSLGGGATIILGFSSWLGKVWATHLMTKQKAEYAQELESLKNRFTHDIESYKIKLRKSEFLFQKEFEAASEFVAITRSFLPNFYHQDMDWYDVCDHLARDFDIINKKLNSYLSKHGAVLKPKVKDLLSIAISIAREHEIENGIIDVPISANKAADELYKNLNEAESILLEQVHSQTSS